LVQLLFLLFTFCVFFIIYVKTFHYFSAYTGPYNKKICVVFIEFCPIALTVFYCIDYDVDSLVAPCIQLVAAILSATVTSCI